MAQSRTLKIFKTIGKAGLWIIGSLLVLVLLLVLALQLPSVQTYLTSQAAGYLEKKIKTRVEVGGVNVAFPKKVVLSDVYIEDQQKDTLLFSHRLAVDIDMLGLMNHSVAINGIELETFTGHVNRTLPDSSFNFDFIINAFSDSVTVAKEDTTGKPWQISIEDISLKNIYATYTDEVSKQAAVLQLGELELAFKELDLNKAIYSVDEISLAHTSLAYTSTAPAATNAAQTSTDAEEDTTSSPMTIGLQQLTLEDVHVKYYDQASGQNLKADIGESHLEANTFDLTGQEIALDEFSLKNSVIRYQQEARKTVIVKTTPSSAKTAPADTAAAWRVSLKDLSLADNHIIYDDFNLPAQAAGMDFAHLLISDIQADAEDIRYHGNSILANIKTLQMREKSGFSLQEFQTNVQVTDQKAEATAIHIRTGNSSLDGSVKATFRSLAALSREYPQMGIDAQVTDARLSIKDALYFQPDLLKQMPLRIPDNTVLNVKTDIQGKVNNLAIKELQASTLNNTRLNANGHIRNLPDIDRTTLQLAILPFETSALDIQTLVPPTMLPASVRIPQHMQLTTTIAGAVHDLTMTAQLRTTLGNLLANAHLKTNKAFSTGSYQAKLNADNLALGRLLKQEKDLGNLTATATIDGSGFSIDEMRTQMLARIQSVQYKKYTYRNIAIDGLAHPSQFAANVSLVDSNLNFTLIGSADYRKKVPNYVAVVDLKKADWQKLNLTQRDLQTRARITADLNYESIDNINGKVDIRQVAVASKGKVYTIDSLLYASVQSKEKTDIEFNSDVMSGYFRGNVNWSGLYGALERHLTRYYALPNSPPYSDAEPQNFEFELNLKNTTALTELLVPGLDSLRPGKIYGKFDSRRAQLDMLAQIYKVNYAGIRIDTAVFSLDSDPRRMRAIFSVEQVQQSDFSVRNLSFQAQAAESNLVTQLILRDSVNKQKYLLAGNFHSLPNRAYSFHFFPDSVKFNYKPWQVSPDNSIVFSKEGFRFNDLVFSESTQKFSLANVNRQPSSLQAGFDNFRLETLSEMLRADTSLISGLLNGRVSLFRQQRDTVITANLDIKDLSYSGQPVGNLVVAAEQRQANRFDVTVDLSGNGNDMDVKGYYLTNAAANSLNFDVDINQLNLKSFEAFAESQLNELSGNAAGQFAIRGSAAKPAVNGELTFQNAVMNLKLLNSPFRLQNQTIQLDQEGIHFNKFTIQDSASRNIVVNGDVLTQDFSYYKLRLRVNSDRFQVLNTTSKDNKLYYGKLITSSVINIRGDSYKPVINANVKVDGGSNVTYVVPQSDDAVAGREGVVRFVDGTEQDVYIRNLKATAAKDTATSQLQGFELTTNIEIDSNSTLNVIIDPVAGDQLSIKGETTLSMAIDPTGNIDLTGRYQVQSGTYNLSFYGLVKREFSLDRNSSITWSGNPYNAEMDIRATYLVEAPPAELIKNQVSDQRLNQAKQRIPFLVTLILKGELLKPEISFKLDMPEDKKGALGGIVYATIQEINTRESDLNKQVFALFLLQRFVSDNPLENTAGGGLESNVRSSVSKILTDQLNQLANKIQGIELELDVNSYEDYSSGNSQGRTQLELGLSKNLFNDRIVVKVTGNVDLEGSPTTSQQDLSNFVGDLQLEYKLTSDGRLRLLGFRQRDFDIISGELIRTGGGIIFVRDYNSFRELFTKALQE